MQVFVGRAVKSSCDDIEAALIMRGWGGAETCGVPARSGAALCLGDRSGALRGAEPLFGEVLLCSDTLCAPALVPGCPCSVCQHVQASTGALMLH